MNNLQSKTLDIHMIIGGLSVSAYNKARNSWVEAEAAFFDYCMYWEMMTDGIEIVNDDPGQAVELEKHQKLYEIHNKIQLTYVDLRDLFYQLYKLRGN